MSLKQEFSVGWKGGWGSLGEGNGVGEWGEGGMGPRGEVVGTGP
jgi:hypothetical protein